MPRLPPSGAWRPYLAAASALWSLYLNTVSFDPGPDGDGDLTPRVSGAAEPWLLEVFGLALVIVHSPSLVEAFGGPTPISLAEFRAGG